MGAGASLDADQNQRNERRESAGAMLRYYCHECSRSFLPPAPSPAAASPQHCPFCNSSFLEEIPQQHQEAAAASSSRQGGRGLLRRLSEEQTRRLTNAASMLQLLEAQLRDELERLQGSLALAGEQGEPDKPPPFTQGMRDSLKNVKTSIPMICEQPR
jgi:hypothetical protein